MASQRNTGAFVVGGVIGGLIGAAVTLWKTPKSGEELLSGLSANRGESNVVTFRASDSGVERGQRFSNPVLSFVEKAAAPIVGVQLGKLAKDDPEAMTSRPVRASSADAKAPTLAGVHPVAGEPVEVPSDPASSGGVATSETGTPGVSTDSPYTSAATTGPNDVDVVNPSETETHDSEEGSTAHAATTEELTH
ncbi:MAG TPA: hypothetical protein VD789_02945, partial [Thermomicrobiales bacterium]|nr:hypothetical protein [Thermomicrobiales bacterium]